MITTSIVFDHRGRTKKGEEGPLELRVIVNRKPYYINTGVRVREKQWSFDQIVRHPQSDELNERLGIIARKVIKKVNACIDSGQDVDIAKIRHSVWDEDDGDSIIAWMRNEIERLGVRDGTYRHYKSVVKRIEEYGEISTWKDVTLESIYTLDSWLRRLPGRNGAGKISGGGVYNYHKCLRTLFARAEKRGLLEKNPYHLLRGEFPKGDRENTEYLTEDEMRKIMAFTPAPGTYMEHARDIFIFQMFTGLSYSDTQVFDFSLYKKVKGKWRIIGYRIKTGVPFVNQLLPPAVEVLERNGWQVPKMTNQAYNRELKQVGIAAGITFPLHSHLARHTFATYMLRNGVKIENLSKMLGHANIKQTQRYAKVLAESVHEEFDMIENKMKANARKEKKKTKA